MKGMLAHGLSMGDNALISIWPQVGSEAVGDCGRVCAWLAYVAKGSGRSAPLKMLGSVAGG